MLKALRILRNYLCYCGIERAEYRAVKKDAYVSNYKVWRTLNCLIATVFGILFVASLFDPLLVQNRPFYLVAFLLSAVIIGIFFAVKKDSVLAQLLIYLSISLLFLFSAFITQNKPELPATTFIVMLLITPMFMIDKPFFMGIELTVASAVFLVWMHFVKPYTIWRMDLINILIFTFVGFFLHVIANSIRIKEFVLTKKINLQKDTDDMTGLKNKGALTREINDFLANVSKNKGILFILDIDRFKSINDTYGHDVGDQVIRQLAGFLDRYFKNGEIVGRFGGDEFIFFIKDVDDEETAGRIASEIVSGVPQAIRLPDETQKTSASIGIALYHGAEKNYSELFKKADTALYEVKATRIGQYLIYK